MHASTLNKRICKMSYMTTLQKRMAILMAQSGLSVGEVADIAGVSSSAVSQWKDGPTKSIKTGPATRLEAATGFQARWLATGEGPMRGANNVAPASMGTIRIPLISYVQAGMWTEVSDPYQPGDASDWLQTDLKLSDSAFALEIEGDSMLPEFRPGDRIIIDPALSPRPGDYVVAKNGEEEATFKKYRPRGINANGDMVFELVPLNDDYPTLNSDMVPIRIIGVMVEHRKYRQRY